MSEATVSPPGRPTTAVLPGWYGKLPYLGDFASRRLPASFVRPWDRWCSAAGQCAQPALAHVYRSRRSCASGSPAPARRARLGRLLMPSVDRRRHFPLTVAQPIGSLARLASGAWFDAADAAAPVLDVEFSVDDLEQTLLQVAALELPAADAGAERLAEQLLGRCAPAAAPCSVWWTGAPGDSASSLSRSAAASASRRCSALG
jgi:type VI secretion system protein ImpM